jgi:hypothetical protein
MMVYAEKIGAAPAKEDTAELQRGRWLEPAVFAALKERHPDWTVKTAKTYFRDTERRIGCTPDGAAEIPGSEGFVVVQAKTVGSLEIFRRGWQGGEKDGPIEAPLPYQLQTLCEGMLTGARSGLLAVLILTGFGVRYEEVWVPRDEEAEDGICKTAAAFWEALESGRPPRADFKLDDKAIEWLHPREKNLEPLDLTGDNELAALCAEYCHLRDHLGECEDRKKEIGAMLKDRLGDHKSAIAPGGYKFSWGLMERPEHVVQAWSGRVLRVTKPKPKKESANAEE